MLDWWKWAVQAEKHHKWYPRGTTAWQFLVMIRVNDTC